MFQQTGNRDRRQRTLAWGVVCSALLTASVGAQQVTTTIQTVQPSSRGGLLGQPAVLPNVLGWNRSLPIERQITLPGLPAGTPTVYQPGTVGIPAVVGGRHYYYDDGVRVDGSYDGDDLRLRFHLGTGADLLRRGRYSYYPVGTPTGATTTVMGGSATTRAGTTTARVCRSRPGRSTAC